MDKSPDSVTILFSDYENKISSTKTLPSIEINPILFGLFGEVGSLLSTHKKLIREDEAFRENYLHNIEEELGDILWYVVTLCKQININFSVLVSKILDNKNFTVNVAANSGGSGPVAKVASITNTEDIDSTLLLLGEKSAPLLKIKTETTGAKQALIEFIEVYIKTVQVSQVPFANVLKRNIDKTRGRFIEPPAETLSKFDSEFPPEERLPHDFRVKIIERNGKCSTILNDVTIGNSLSDDIAENDDYRFHDVFHLANAAVLHWSPAFRNLIKHNRRSQKEIYETEDSNRARNIDEGLSAYIFAYAAPLNFFEGHEKVSFDLLKTIQNFVRGYEVDKCPLYLWEKAILQGYEVFRKIRKNRGGVVVGSRKNRTVKYEPLEQ